MLQETFCIFNDFSTVQYFNFARVYILIPPVLANVILQLNYIMYRDVEREVDTQSNF
jgi:hypothetical protein